MHMHKNKRNSLFVICCLFFLNGFTQPTVTVLTKGTKTSIRGLSVVTDNIVWVSGSNGTVGRSLDGGANWKWIKVPGYDSIDFRDIEAFSSTDAVIMGISEPAYILKTVNGGETWKKVYENRDKGMFLDAMEFWDMDRGIVIGDPINGKFFVAHTRDGGSSWIELSAPKRPLADSGEAFFASSGTNIRTMSKDEACFVSGGLNSRFFGKKKTVTLPLGIRKETTGANSVAVSKKQKCIIVCGGDFMKPDSIQNNCIISTDKGETWKTPAIPPHGYRSCVEFINKTRVISCGINGVDYSADRGNTWQWISREGFHVCRKAKDGNAVYFAGGNGRIGKLVENK
jgi:hypothetical protein